MKPHPENQWKSGQKLSKMAKPKTPPIEIMEISCQKRVIVLSCDRFEWHRTIVLIKQENKKIFFHVKISGFFPISNQYLGNYIVLNLRDIFNT